MAGDQPAVGPPVSAFDAVFRVDEVRRDGETLLYFGDPRAAPDALEERVWPLFREAGYEVHLTTVDDAEVDPITGVEIPNPRYVLVAKPHSTGVDGVPWTNLGMAVLTVLTTLYAGLAWYGLSPSDPLSFLQAWPFAAAVLGVLGVHELGHYVASRYYRVDASLPYFIPIPTIFGTMGAVIKMEGRIPSRRALFDIGIAGPLAGLVAAVSVTAVGLQLDPVQSGPVLQIAGLNYPPLIQFIAYVTGAPLDPGAGMRVNPVVVGGWVGMFVTFLNLLPVGQLDGGHVVRAMIGERQETVGALVPAGLFGLGAYLTFIANEQFEAVLLWFFWGLIAMALAYAGPARPVQEERLGTPRMAVGVLTFVLGLLCFTPVPFQLAPL